MSLSETLQVQAILREMAEFEVRERCGKTTREDGRADWKGSMKAEERS